MSSSNEQVKIAWLDDILLKLKCRNQLHNNNIIYNEYYHQWKKNIHYENQYNMIQYNLALLEHETSDYIKKNNFQLAINNMNHHISFLSNELKIVYNNNNYHPTLTSSLQSSSSSSSTTSAALASIISSEKTNINFNKMVYDQKVNSLLKEEEIKIIKNELNLLTNKYTNINEELTISKQLNQELTLEIEDCYHRLKEKEDLILKLSNDNKILTDRIMLEKEKNINELNEMNKILEGLILIVSKVSRVCILVDNKNDNVYMIDRSS